MEETPKAIFDNLVIACAYEELRSHEYIVPEHLLGIHLSGETEVESNNKRVVYKEGSIILVRRNSLFRSLKVPGSNGEYKAIVIFLTEAVLRKYAAVHKLPHQERYTGDGILTIVPNAFIEGYFSSLLPYTNSSVSKTHSLSDIKIQEAIELLLEQDPGLQKILFDFSEPHRIDLRQFMLENYKFNVPIAQFAQLTGRSLAGFKRDFKATFNQSPRQWLQDQRLSEAHRLITAGKQKPADIYLEIGFENLSHFYFSFKQKYGVTPAELTK